MCRSKDEGGRRCACAADLGARRGYARAKYAADAVEDAAADFDDGEEMLDLYHRTTAEAAEAIYSGSRMRSLENTQEAYFSTVRDAGQGEGYGDAVVHIRIPADLAELDDEFPDGEQHYRVPIAAIRPQHFQRPLAEEQVGEANTAALVEAWGERGAEIAERVDVVPSAEEMDALYAHRGADLRAWRERVLALTDEDIAALSDAEVAAISGSNVHNGLPEEEQAALIAAAKRVREERNRRDLGFVPGANEMVPQPSGNLGYRIDALRDRPIEELTADERIALKAAAICDAEYPGKTRGSTARFQTTQVRVEPSGIYVNGNIDAVTSSGQAARRGGFMMTLRPPLGDNPTWSGYLDSITVDDRLQGRGYGTRMVRQMENSLIAAGVPHIELTSAMSVGGYAWARAGYDWKPGCEPVDGAGSETGGNIRRRLTERAAQGDPGGQIQSMLDRLARRDDPETYPTPMEVAMVGWTPGAESWPGKDVMAGSIWYARKTLTPTGASGVPQ